MLLNSDITYQNIHQQLGGFPDGSTVKNPPVNAGDVGLIPESEFPTCRVHHY